MLMFHVGGGSAAALAPGLLALLKGLVFPIGLSMILLSGSELMTGNFLTQCLPSLKEAPLAQRARILALSGTGNLAGSLAMVAGTVAIGNQNTRNKHAYAGQLNSFTSLRALWVLHDRGILILINILMPLK
jgi:formate/nitrite transporter FocA (FNT family)